MKWRIAPSQVGGDAEVPGDKSIGHRALLLAGLADGVSRIHNLPSGGDVRATARCLTSLGSVVVVDGAGVSVRGGCDWQRPPAPLDAGNSGTTMRLLAGVLAGQPFPSCLVGDPSLSRRPMERVVLPLRQMGARIESTDGTAPLLINSASLHGIEYTLSVASAQVKSSVLLAGLHATGTTTVVEPVATRDHTERMLQATGVEVQRHSTAVSVQGGSRPAPFEMTVPGDPSSAAFLAAAAVLTGGNLTIRDVGINPTRIGFLQVLQRMGSPVRFEAAADEMGEPVGNISVSGRPRRPVTVDEEEVPLLVDELPLVALLATQADGRCVVSGAAELRKKESDRIEGVAQGLRALGAQIEPRPDGWLIEGPSRLRGARVESMGDHRLAMMLAVAGLIAEGETVVEGAEAADISFPGFVETLSALGGEIRVD